MVYYPIHLERSATSNVTLLQGFKTCPINVSYDTPIRGAKTHAIVNECKSLMWRLNDIMLKIAILLTYESELIG